MRARGGTCSSSSRAKIPCRAFSARLPTLSKSS
jgi:hypothetical protein